MATKTTINFVVNGVEELFDYGPTGWPDEIYETTGILFRNEDDNINVTDSVTYNALIFQTGTEKVAKSLKVYGSKNTNNLAKLIHEK